MAKSVEQRIFGVDVSKRSLDIATEDSTVMIQIANEPSAIGAWIEELHEPVAVALEATNRYHEAMVLQLTEAGHCVYLVDGLRVSKYRQAIGRRAKTDALDAALLARYLRSERSELRPAQPLSPDLRRFFCLMRFRASLTRSLTRLRQSAADLQIDDPDKLAWLGEGKTQLKRIDRQLQQLMRRLGWSQQVARCQSVPGIGPLNAMALTALLARGHFRSADAFVAFIGLDVRVRQSGTYRGRAKLTKKGDPEIRRLLFNAAMAARRDAHWKTYYQRQIDKGLPTTAALMVLARKLVRVCFALVRKQTEYDPSLTGRSCQTT